MYLSGKMNGYDIEPLREDDNRTHELTCVDCGCSITDGHKRCTVCEMFHRVESQAVIPPEQYLHPTPPGMELIWYPRMAISSRGKKILRRRMKDRLKKYFERLSNGT